MHILKMTRSICPECFKVLDATIYEKNGIVYIKKNCIEHGPFQDIYWSDIKEYQRVKKYTIEGDGIENCHSKIVKGHPFDCGLCPNHKTHTNLAIIDVTNRCNLKCPICFSNATSAGYVYEPTKKQIEEMIR
ncbi:radical SAM protein, partial [Candidatus Bathyarchaeota archaeon]|nr:radical SAM protein [Candidatus Bathyarchaeota archaeon]